MTIKSAFDHLVVSRDGTELADVVHVRHVRVEVCRHLVHVVSHPKAEGDGGHAQTVGVVNRGLVLYNLKLKLLP